MKLLLDQNLSFRLVEPLQDTYPDTTQVRLVSLEHAGDRTVWEYAREHGFVIVTKDSDFHELSLLAGPPPKVIWLRVGNAPTRAVLELLTGRADELYDALGRDDVYYVELY
jgi:predicted nuclease of predicted toxin-antitoxin system